MFLQQYSVTVSQELITRNLPLLKVEAISRNSNNSMNIAYSILDNFNQLFFIDSVDGFIYSTKGSGIEPRVYKLTVRIFNFFNLQK